MQCELIIKKKYLLRKIFLIIFKRNFLSKIFLYFHFCALENEYFLKNNVKNFLKTFVPMIFFYFYASRIDDFLKKKYKDF